MTEEREEQESMAKAISATLNGLCPYFSNRGSGPLEWHRCTCSKNGDSHDGRAGETSPCDCVWHIKDICINGRWQELAYVQSYKGYRYFELTTKEKEKPEDPGINDRFEILDL
jgi:hypothetical protein